MKMHDFIISRWKYILAFLVGFLLSAWLFKGPKSKKPYEPPGFVRELTNAYFNKEVIPERKEVIPERKEVIPERVSSPIFTDIEEDIEPIMIKPTYQINYIPKTKRSIGEEECCRVMRELTGKPFETARPSFLMNPATGRNLELDCYNDELRIAVEYNGEQHYNFKGAFNQTERTFLDQAKRDILKRELCDENDIYLITVPYHVRKENIYQYIVDRLPPGFLDDF